MKTNVIDFPGHGGGNRHDPDDKRAMESDFLAMANHVAAMADKTPWPRWTKCVAAELRRIARDMGERR